MKKTFGLSVFIIFFFNSFLLAYSEDFEKYQFGDNILKVAGPMVYAAPEPEISLDPGIVRQNDDDPVNHTLVLEHKSNNTSVITRLLQNNVGSLTGEVFGFVDIKPISGSHSIYFWQHELDGNERGAYITFSNNSVFAVHDGDGPKKQLCSYQPGNWYRVMVRMNIDSKDGTKSKYDVFIQDIAGMKLTASEKELFCPGSPVRIGGGQLLSGSENGMLHAYFDNWVVSEVGQTVKDKSEDYILDEGFTPESMYDWDIELENTAASAVICPEGYLSPTSLEINKPDTTGTIFIKRKIPVPSSSKLRITADLQSIFTGPLSLFFLEARQLDSNNTLLSSERLDFFDGVIMANKFGGFHKSPQTMGQWKTTYNDIETKAETSHLELAICFGKGQQKFRVDNIRVSKVGKDDKIQLPIYSKIIDGPAAFLDLDMLLPNFTYELRAVTDTDDHDGFGVLFAWEDINGQISSKKAILPFKDEGKELVYRFAVPENAVSIQLDLYNSDLTTMGPFKAGKYREWETVSLHQLSSCPAIDSLFSNYTMKRSKNRELSKLRNISSVSDYDRLIINEHLRNRPNVDAKIKKINGGMTFVINGKNIPPVISSSTDVHLQSDYLDVYKELGQKGIDLRIVSDVYWGPAYSGRWPAPGEYNFSGIDKIIYEELKSNPDVYIILDIDGLYPPTWWGDANPDQILRDSDGRALSMRGPHAFHRMWGNIKDGSLGKIHENKYRYNNWVKNRGGAVSTTYFPSPASKPYREIMKEYLTALRRHIESQPYGKTVIGYRLKWGYDIQWGWPIVGYRDLIADPSGKIYDRKGGLKAKVDYSKPMLEYFRNFLRKKYKIDRNLQHAWNDPEVTFETAKIPTPGQRRPKVSQIPDENKGLKFLLDPATERQVIDYNICYGFVVGDLLNELSMHLKQASSKDTITVAYFKDVRGRYLGHDHVLTNPGLDVTGGPDYNSKDIGKSGISAHYVDSYRMHGKLEIYEADTRVFPVLYRSYRNNLIFETPRKSISVMRRDFTRQLCKGGGIWTYDMGFGWFQHPIMVDTVAQINNMYKTAASADKESPAKMAIFISGYSTQIMALPGMTTRRYHLIAWINSMYPHSGVPVDIYRLIDLPSVADKYKVFIFPHSFGLTDEEIQNINNLKRDDNLLVFGPAAGYVSSTRKSVENVEQLTGMKMKQNDFIPWTVKVTSKHPLVRQVRGYIGSDEKDHIQVSFPMFYVTDPQAVGLGEYVGSGKGKIGLAIKDQGNWQSLYIGAMGLFPPELFRGMAEYKGLHIYSKDGDVMYFAKGLIGVHASTDGIKTLELPEPGYVRSLWDDKPLGKVKTIRRPMKIGDNALYMIQQSDF